MRSIDIGVVRLSERMLPSDPPASEELRQARDWIRTETEAAVVGMPLPVGLTFVGTAGTITALAAMDQQLAVYDAARIHNYLLTLDAGGSVWKPSFLVDRNSNGRDCWAWREAERMSLLPERSSFGR